MQYKNIEYFMLSLKASTFAMSNDPRRQIKSNKAYVREALNTNIYLSNLVKSEIFSTVWEIDRS